MRIAVLSDPNNFHTQKWAKALLSAGAEVIVMSYDAYLGTELQTLQLQPPIGRQGNYSYLDYLQGGNVLREALAVHRIDVLNPLNVTPFAVWAQRSGFHPTVACAFGADILEYPPTGVLSPADAGRVWESLDVAPRRTTRWLIAWKRRFFRKRVAAALAHADLVTGDNQFLVDSMRDWFGIATSKLQVLRWGVEPALFETAPATLAALRARFGIQPGQCVVLSPRGAKPIYQTDIILEAFELCLAQGCKNTVFIQLGAGYAVAPAIGATARKLAALYPNFQFVAEALTREELHALWQLVDVFVSAPVYDGYSAALAEGRYAGAIPVVNDIPAHQELIVHQENGWICTPFTASQLAKDLSHICTQVDVYQAIFAPRNRDWILEHSLIADNARRFLALVEQRCLVDGKAF